MTTSSHRDFNEFSYVMVRSLSLIKYRNILRSIPDAANGTLLAPDESRGAVDQRGLLGGLLLGHFSLILVAFIGCILSIERFIDLCHMLRSLGNLIPFIVGPHSGNAPAREDLVKFFESHVFLELLERVDKN